jgi:hypothetical protein
MEDSIPIITGLAFNSTKKLESKTPVTMVKYIDVKTPSTVEALRLIRIAFFLKTEGLSVELATTVGSEIAISGIMGARGVAVSSEIGSILVFTDGSSGDCNFCS